MVAGMVMPLSDLRAIYELLFQDGVIVTKKDKRPQSMHPDVKGVTNFKVIRAMGSLKSKGYVRETYAWKHAYYYLTNQGISYLRDYLHLPLEIMPASLQRVRHPASSARIQTVKTPTTCIPKPGPGGVSQEAMMDKRVYRHKRVDEERERFERPPKYLKAPYQHNAMVQPGFQTFFQRGKNFCRGEDRWPKKGHCKLLETDYFSVEDKSIRSLISIKKDKLPEDPRSSPVVPTVPKEILVVPTLVEQATIKKPTDELLADVPEVKADEQVLVDPQIIPLLGKLTEAAASADSDYYVAAFPPTGIDDFTDLLEEKVADYDVEDTEKVTTEIIPMKVISQLHVASETLSSFPPDAVSGPGLEQKKSVTFEADCPAPVDLSECPQVEPKTTLNLGDCGFTEDPEAEEVRRVWPDFLEGPMPTSPPGNVFPTLVVVGHIVTLIAVWQWRIRKNQGFLASSELRFAHLSISFAPLLEFFLE
ncbi:hypothetical protein PAMA_011829 [Pampus argenteus]